MQGHWYVLVQLGGPLVHSVISRLILPCFMPPTFDYADQVVRWYVLVQLGGPLVHSVIPRLILPCFMTPTFDYADQVVRWYVLVPVSYTHLTLPTSVYV